MAGLGIAAAPHARTRPIDGLQYPANSLVVLAGIPGAGKSTLLRRLFPDPDDRRVLDPEHLRARWMPILGTIPYAWWRPLLHLVHYIRVLRAIRAGGPLVLHDCATRPWVRYLVGRQARRSGLGVHLILLDVPEHAARTGQQTRGRVVASRSMTTHTHRWPHLLTKAAKHPGSVIPGARTAVVLTRPQASRLHKLTFGSHRNGDPEGGEVEVGELAGNH